MWFGTSLAAMALVPIIRLPNPGKLYIGLVLLDFDVVISLFSKYPAIETMGQWLRDIWDAVSTVAHGLWVTLRYWLITYRPERRTFTEHFEYPELPVPVAARYRGFHRYDLTTCIACDQCAKACPDDLIALGGHREPGQKIKVLDYFDFNLSRCSFCGLCEIGRASCRERV